MLRSVPRLRTRRASPPRSSLSPHDMMHRLTNYFYFFNENYTVTPKKCRSSMSYSSDEQNPVRRQDAAILYLHCGPRPNFRNMKQKRYEIRRKIVLQHSQKNVIQLYFALLTTSTNFSYQNTKRSSTSHKVTIAIVGFVDYTFKKRNVK
jgi:hypothetical protein